MRRRWPSTRAGGGASVLLGVAALWAGGGCASGVTSQGFSARVIPNSGADEVFQAAQSLLRTYFGRVRVDPREWTIETYPEEYGTRTDSGTARDLYGGPSTMRRTAKFQLSERGPDTVAQMRVVIERQDTRRREVFQAGDNRLTDAPAYTPIERDAATTPEQETVWTFVKRDYQLERELLTGLVERFAPEPEALEGEEAGEEGTPGVMGAEPQRDD